MAIITIAVPADPRMPARAPRHPLPARAAASVRP